MQLAKRIAPATEAERAAFLCKADLTTGMVSEFPELQGTIGSYYAKHDNEARTVVSAIRDHYRPKGPNDLVPTDEVTVAVGLADRLELITAFFSINEKPTGSGDPFALRRAAIGVIRLVIGRLQPIPLRPLIELTNSLLRKEADTDQVLTFIRDRLRVVLKEEHRFRYDVIEGILSVDMDDDIYWLAVRIRNLNVYLQQPNGIKVVAANKRVDNILKSESELVSSGNEVVDPKLFSVSEESYLRNALVETVQQIDFSFRARNSDDLTYALGILVDPINRFFDKVTVNHHDPALRRNRLNMLHQVRATMDRVADFSRIEG